MEQLCLAKRVILNLFNYKSALFLEVSVFILAGGLASQNSRLSRAACAVIILTAWAVP